MDAVRYRLVKAFNWLGIYLRAPNATDRIISGLHLDEKSGLYNECITFRAYHEARSPKEVTRVLNLIPEHTSRAGARTRFPEFGPVPTNGWFVSSARFTKSVDPVLHLAAMVEFVRSRRAEIERLRANGWDIDLFTWAFKEVAVPELEAKFLQDSDLVLNRPRSVRSEP